MDKALFLRIGGILILTVAICIADLVTPQGMIVWLLYILPLLLTYFSPSERAPIYFAALITMLGIIEFFLSPTVMPLSYALVNFSLGVCVVWACAIVLMYLKQAHRKLAVATAGRGQAEAKTLASSLHMEGIVQSAMDAIITVNAEQKIVLFNRAAEEIFRCPVERVIGQSLDRFIPPRFREAHPGHVRSFGASGTTSRRIGALGRIVGLRPGGEEFPLEASISQFNMDGKQYFTVILRDITQREQVQKQLERTSKALRTLSRVNQVLIRATSEQDFMRDLCHIMVEVNNYRLAWFGLIGDDPDKAVRPIACASAQADLTDLSGMTGIDTGLGSAPARAAIQSCQPYIARNILTDPAFAPWREDAQVHGYHSSLTLPFPCGRCSIGILQIYASEQDAFNHDEVGFLTELAEDAAYGIQQLRTQELLYKAHERLTAIIHASPAAIVVLDPDGCVQLWNQAAERIFGWLEKEVLGSPLPTIPPDKQEEHRSFRQEILGGRAFLGKPVVRQRRDGTLIDVSLSTATLRDAEGRAIGILGIMADITEQKLAERNQQTSELRYRRLFESAQDGILIMNPHTNRIVDANPYVEDLLGYARGELLGKTLADIGPLKDTVAAHLSFQELKKSRFLRYDDLPLESKDGQHRYEVEFVSNLYTVDGVDVIQCNIRNVTARKEMERKASRLEELATMGQLMGGIAHEMKNPLFVLTGRLQLVQEKLAGREYDKIEADFGKISDAAQRMTAIIQRFLAFARPHQLERADCAVNVILQKTVDFLSNELMKNRIRIVTSLDPHLPPVWGNERALHQIFTNLILNAIYAMTHANGRGTLTISTAVSGNAIDVRIQDDGPGITPEHRAKLFEPFFTTKPVGEGTGLGLWTVKSAISSMRGMIACETAVGKGSSRIITLPGAPPSDRHERSSHTYYGGEGRHDTD